MRTRGAVDKMRREAGAGATGQMRASAKLLDAALHLDRAWRPGLARAGVLLAVCCAYSVAAVTLTWPIAANLGSAITSPLDPLDSVWRVAWGQRQLLHAPSNLFEAPGFYPFRRTYLFDELLLGAAIVALPIRLLTSNPVTVYNVAVLSSFVLSAVAMFALARRLGTGRTAAFAAGLFYSFAPLRMAHIFHLGLLSGQYFPLVILLLARLFSAPSWRDALLLAIAMVLQALSAQYYAIYLVLVVGLFVAVRMVQGLVTRQFPSPGVWVRLLGAGLLALALVAPFAVAYRDVQTEYGFTRAFGENAFYSARLRSFFTADEQHLVWGRLTAPLRELGSYSPERNQFPGLLALLLAGAGLARSWRQPLALYLALLGGAAALLALAARLPFYRLLYDNIPGNDSMRVPARIGILFGLSVAALAGLGFQRILNWVASSGRRPLLRVGLAVALIGGIGVESLNRPFPMTAVPTGNAIPPVYQWLATQPPGALIELPFFRSSFREAELYNNRYQYFSLYYPHRVVNGAGNVAPKGFQALGYELEKGLTPRALAILQGLGVNYIAVHYDQLDQRTATRTKALLQATSGPARPAAVFGDAAVYLLAPNERFDQLRAVIPSGSSVFLSREDRLGTYMAMLGTRLEGRRLYARLRVSFGARYERPPPGGQYDYAILYRNERPAAAGFPTAVPVWADDVAIAYRLR